ncbi:MAG TPA: ATP-binding cassette domain-containing protein [Candidatus Dormibacteraeota bacterium]|nr:ATP-binding cassette domain-containing protein [Candidatus Dormibacteraeota bacterium]
MSRRRIAAACTAATAVAVLLATRVAPSQVPLGIVVQGAILGTGTGLLAVGLVLTYRATRAINFAYGAIGGVGAALAVGLHLGHGLPWPLAILVALATGVAVGGLVERLVIRRFENAPRLVLTVATIGLAQLLGGVELLIPQLLGTNSLVGGFETPLTRFSINIDPVIITGNDLLIVAVVPAVLAALSWFLLRTEAGMAIRGIAENADRARLLGIPVGRLSLLVWLVAGGFAALTVTLTAPGSGLTIDAAAGATLLLPALAAAVVADLESLPAAFVVGVGLGVLDQVVRWNVDKQATETVVFLAVIMVALLVRHRRTSRVDADLSSWSITSGARPIAAALRALPEVRASRALAIVVVAVAALLVPALATPSQLDQASIWLVYGLVAISLVVLTGWGGTVSLGQMGIVGVGALIAGNLISRWNVDLFLAIGGGAVAGGLVALLVGLPALRVRGLFLAVTTLAFAVAVDSFFLNPANFRTLIFEDFERPVLWHRFDLRSERALYLVCLGVLVLTVLLVQGLRRARSGRVLIAVRDNQRAAAAIAVPTVRTRLTGFVVAGVIAGVAGALHATVLRSIGFHTYETSLSLLVFSMAVIGGLGSIGGALSGVAFVELAGYLFPKLQLLITGAGMLFVLLVIPGGIAEAAERARDRMLALIARRRGIDLARAADASTAEVVETAIDGVAAPVGERPALLRCQGVDAGYGSLQVLFGADLAVAEGEILALLGTNGAGKSTLLRCVAGLLDTTAGSIEFDGASVHGHTERLAGRGLALMPGGRGVFPGLTVAENLRLACWLIRSDRDATRAATERNLELFEKLRGRLGIRAGELSGGEQQMLSLAMALATSPRLLCIDELSLGLAPAVVGQLVETVRDIHRGGTTVVVVEQSVDVALQLAERAVFLEKGHVRFSGPTAELTRRPDLLRAVFLGRQQDAEDGAQAGGQAPVRGVRLEITGLTRRFGGIVAVDGVDLAVEPGEVVGLIGHNGAGKTTLFDVVTGFLDADGGRVVLGGHDITDRPPHRRAIAGLGRSFQEARLFPSLTVAETIAVALERHLANRDPLAAALRLPASTDAEAAAAIRVDELVTALGLRAYRDTLCGELSTGTRRVVELACVLAQDPAVVLLDEPSAGMAQRETEALARLLRTVRAQTGCAMLVIEHDMALLSSLCDRLVALELGAVIAQGTPDAVLHDPRVVTSYLGGGRSSSSNGATAHELTGSARGPVPTL